MKSHATFVFLILVLALTMQACSSLKHSNEKEQKVLIQTTEGDITLKLYNETPLHRNNFIKLVNAKTYNGLLFHRVIKEFMIQGGDPQSKTAGPDTMLGDGDVGYTVSSEFRTPQIYHKYGTIAAAREGDDSNPQKASSGCQFYIVVTYKFSTQARQDYINVGGTPHLDGNYTVFGEILKGMEVVEKISEVETDKHDRPIKAIRIKKMKLIR